MNFKPTKWKVIVSIIAVILWIIILTSMKYNFMCKLCQMPVCVYDFDDWMIVKPICDCSCQSFSEMFWSNAKIILIPFALVYIIWSLFEKNKKRRK